MYDLIALALLMRGPTHGYVIAGVVNDVIGPFARASNGRLYPMLSSLTKRGFIEVYGERTTDGGRVARSFSITKPGREYFRFLMLETSESPREYRDRFAFKVTAFDQIDHKDRLDILRHYVQFADAHVRHLKAQADDLAKSASYGHTGVQRARFAEVFAHLVLVWERESTWATELLKSASSRRLDGTQIRPKAKKRGT